MSKYSNFFTIYYQNVRGLNTKLLNLYNSTVNCCYDLVAFTETWLNSSVSDSEVFCQGYVVFRSDRNFDLTNTRTGGGVILALNRLYHATKLDFSDLSNQLPMVDIVGVKLFLKSIEWYIFVIYIPPGSKSMIYDTLYDYLSSKIVFLNINNLILLGDFNIPQYKELSERDNLSFSDKIMLATVNFSEFLNIRQYNLIVNTYNRLLDLVFSSSGIVVNKSMDPLIKEDNLHPALEIELCTSTTNKYFSCESRYNFRRANFPGLYNAILNTNWDDLFSIDDVNSACESFYSILDTIFSIYVPKTITRTNTKFPPWFHSGILRKLKLKKHLHKTFKRTKNDTTYQEFSNLRNEIKIDICNSHTEYIESVERQISSNPSQFWSFLNAQRGMSSIPNSMVFDDILLSDPNAVVNAFASFFQSSFIKSSNHNINKVSLTSFPTCISPVFSEDDVCKALKKLKSKPTAGFDSVPAYIVRDCAYAFAKPLCYLFNLALNTCSFPTVWKLAKICPVFKKGDKSNVENYRPIVIISNFAKVFENLLYNIIYSHAKLLISTEQHGFYPGRSTTSNLVCLTQYISTHLDQAGQVDVIYTDFSKAFDRLDHGILLAKLSDIGLTTPFLTFFASYLKDRKLKVDCRGVRSIEISATSGVPQGSVLGPLLFIIFINDIVLNLRCNSLMYADDLKIFTSVTNIQDCLLLQDSIDKVHRWCTENSLPLNFSKCNFVSFTRKLAPTIFAYNINNELINKCSSFKDLGVTFDQKLTFIEHFNNIQKEALRNLGFVLRQGRHFKETKTIINLFNAFVRPKLEYASLVWDPGYQIHKDGIENIHRRFVKYLWYKTDSIYPNQGIQHHLLLDRFNLKDLASRRECYSLITLHKLLTGKIDCPELLSQICIHVPNRNTRASHLLYFETPKTNIAKFSPLYMMDVNHSKYQNTVDIFIDAPKILKKKVLS